MISSFRRYLDTWVVKIFFGVMVAAFVFWGVGDVVRLAGTDTWIAKVGGTTIEAAAMQAEYQRAMAGITRNLPTGQDPTPELRRRVGEDTIQRLVTQAAMGEELRALRILAPDAAVAELAREIPAFRGPDGKFSKPVFDMVLRNNGMTEARFLDSLRGDVAQRQLLTALGAGAAVSEGLVRAVYVGEYQKRSARFAEFPLAAAAEPSTPDDATLRRWYDNHPDSYMTPEYRRLKAVVLTPQRLAQDVETTEAELRDAFERNRSQFNVAARRSAEVISAQTEDAARTLTEQWRAGADWTAIQAAAQALGASAVAMNEATETAFPDPDLSKAVFSATPDAVTGPVKAALAWYVIKITSATTGETPDFGAVAERIKERVVADKAADLVYDRANKVDGLLANGTTLDDMPDNLGLVGVAGTLDSQGLTQEGELAPIPGATELRNAIIAAAFQAQKGDAPRLTEVQTPSTGGSAYYALTVEDIAPAAMKSFDTVRDQVTADWRADQQRRTQEEAAARMLAALKSGQSFEDALTVAGVGERITPIMTRTEQPEDVPAELQRAIFTMKPGEPTMVETPDAFIVARLSEVIDPDASADPAGHAAVRQAVARSVGGDIGAVFTEAVRLRANSRINQKTLDQIVQP